MAELKESRYRCPKGHDTVIRDDQTEYPFVCVECDENYFFFELYRNRG